MTVYAESLLGWAWSVQRNSGRDLPYVISQEPGGQRS